MAEEEIKVSPVKIDFKCPRCDAGHLRPTGTCLTSNPPQYPHMCDNNDCGYGETFNKIYPFIDYK